MTLRRIYSERVLLTGDAGGFVNPWTGAGIDEGIVASANAAVVCKEAVDSQDFSAERMSRFQRLCAEQMRRISWRGSWVKVLDRIMPMDAEFPFWVRFLVRRFSTVA